MMRVHVMMVGMVKNFMKHFGMLKAAAANAILSGAYYAQIYWSAGLVDISNRFSPLISFFQCNLR